MKKLLLFVIVIGSFNTVRAQFVYDYLKAADNYFLKEDYSSAANYYEKYFEENPALTEDEFNPYKPQNSAVKRTAEPQNKEQSMYRLAESYRLLNYPAKAAPYYKKVMDMAKKQYPLAQYYYGTQLRALAKYPEAEKELTGFLATYNTNDEFKKNANREIQNLKFIQQQLSKKDIKYYTIKKAPGELNTTGASYAPTWLNSNTLLFTSTRPLDSSAKHKYSNRVFQAVYTGGIVSNITKADLSQDKDIHQGVVTVTPDGNTMFLTRWSVAGSKKESAIYTSKRNGDKWSDPDKLNGINIDGANTQQPFVTADGKYLMFSSNRAGGQGGYDLYYAPLENGNVGTPVNMGTVVNTEYDEQAPFYHEASKSLIFSTNGRVGMGGFDFFQSKGTIGNWATPVNLGYPVNSVKEDMYFVSRGSAKNMLEDVMLSSDRDAACCLELFALKKIRPLRQISGRIVSCDPSKPIVSSTVTVVDPATNKIVFTRVLNADGTYSFTLEDHQPLKVKAEASGFIKNEKDMQPPADMEEETLVLPDLCLTPEPPKVDEKFVVQNVYYDYDKAEVKPESYPALDEIVRMLNTYPNMEIELSAHTDSKGSDEYNQRLSEARAQSVVDYLVSKGIAKERLVAKGYGETQPVAPNTIDGKDNPEGREKNRRTEFKVLKNE
jgi:outer membrane protein OmpA-like peptidoglycan-associated protein/tetratricopeptide (TPR) repeat protein